MKTPEEYIADVPVIEVDGPLAICDGHEDPALGMCLMYIQSLRALSITMTSV